MDDTLDDSEWHRTVVVIDRLAELGSAARMPLSRSLGEGLFANMKETTMANYSRWEELKKRRGEPTPDARAAVEQDLALGQLIYDLRTEAGLSQRALAERMGTTQSVISRLEEGGGARNRLDTLARVATALDRHLVVSFPQTVPSRLKNAVQVA
ncbi:MAG TPA: helix-turn-helix transcriptional regulator [Acidimicrobiales bacterium]|nr:helix-turn-helix transcriptional regulator [Acidimicrobiales bacterium]